MSPHEQLVLTDEEAASQGCRDCWLLSLLLMRLQTLDRTVSGLGCVKSQTLEQDTGSTGRERCLYAEDYKAGESLHSFRAAWICRNRASISFASLSP
jgi:hypothetical protein